MNTKKVERSRPVEQIASAISKYPRKPAIIDGEVVITYADLGRIARSISSGIISNRHESLPEPIVAVLCDHDHLLILAIIGTVLSGCGYQPIQSDAPIQRSKAQLATSEAPILLYSKKLYDKAQALKSDKTSILCLEDVLKEYQPLDNEPSVSSKAPAYYLSTSGSTGVPKGVLHDNSSLERTIYNYCQDVKLTSGARVALAQPSVFTPSVFSIFGTICKGATLYVFDLKSNSIQELARWIEKNQINIVNCSTTVFRRLLSDDVSLTSLTSMYVAGEPLYASDVSTYQEAFADKFALLNGMGTTEISCFARFEINADTELQDGLVPIGKPYSDVQALILNSDGQKVTTEEEGELFAIGHYIPSGYFNRPDLSKDCFTIEPDGRTRYRTGDRAKFDQRGNIVHLGRLDSQVKVRGQRVELTEVESALLSNENIDEALVISTQDDNTHEVELFAFFSPVVDSKLVRRFLTDKLPSYMVPTKIIGLPSMPTNASGKIDRMQLKAFDFSNQESTQEAHRLPEDIFQQRVLECFEEILDINNLDIDSDFFECGGNSILATQLTELLQKHLAIPFAVSNLVEGATPRILAAEARRLLRAGEARHLVEFRANHSDSQKISSTTPLFCLPGIYGDALSFRALATELIAHRRVFAFEYPGYDGAPIGYETVEELANICMKELLRVHPEGAVVLLAYSAGGVIAYEVARQLRNEGREIHSIIMMDCYSPLSLKLHRIRDNALSHSKKLYQLFKRDDQTELEKVRNKANDALTIAISKYNARPQPVENVVLLLAEQTKKPLGFFDNFANWDSLYTNGIYRESVSGDHYSLVMPEKSKEISQVIRKFI